MSDLVSRGDPRDDAAWQRRLAADWELAARHQSSEQAAITDVLLERALADGALGFALTGSTARARRTAISDLDYHVVGRRPDVMDLPSDVDIYAITADRMSEKLAAGDDFVQWTIRFGCVLRDSGVFRAAAIAIVEGDIWPDGAAKLRRLPELRRHTERLIHVGDLDAAWDQGRATLTSAARGLLLLEGDFPRARSELPGQLVAAGFLELATALREAIYADPQLDLLERSLSLLDGLPFQAVAS